MSFILLTAFFLGAFAQDVIEVGDDCEANQLISVISGSNLVNIDDASTGISEAGTSIPAISPSDVDVNFIDSAVSTAGVCPGMGGAMINCLYVLYTNAVDGTPYVGYLNLDELTGEAPTEVNILGEVALDPSTLEFTSIAFDDEGNLWGFEGLTTGDVYSINLATGATTLQVDGADDILCENSVQDPFLCFDTMFFNAEEGEFFRISSGEGNAILCEIDSNTCQDISIPGDLCAGETVRVIGATYVDEDTVLITCSVVVEGAANFGESTINILDLDDLRFRSGSGETLPVSPVGLAYLNTETGGFCAPDFDGEEAEDEDDDDDSSDSSDSSPDNALAFLAEIDDHEANHSLNEEEHNEKQNDQEETEISYVVELSDSALTTAWIMFGLCMLVNITVAVCLWMNKKKPEVVV